MAFLNEIGLERLWTHILSKLGTKVDKVSGKGLSTNDYTDDEKNKLANIPDNIDDLNVIYVGPDEPSDPNIKVWINTAEDGTGVIPLLPRITTITLSASNWSGDATPYSQVVEVSSVTAASKVDLQPTASQITSLQNDEIALMAENVNGVITIYAFGGKPASDMAMQVMLTEVAYV